MPKNVNRPIEGIARGVPHRNRDALATALHPVDAGLEVVAERDFHDHRLDEHL